MSFKEQMATDMQAIMNADEVSEDIIYTSGAVSYHFKAVINNEGINNIDWTEGESTQSRIVIYKPDLPFTPKARDTIVDSSGRKWYVGRIAEETFVSWIINLYSEAKIK